MPRTMGTGIRSPQAEAYEVRPASVVLAQGDFETQTSTAGAGGSVTITGSTTILNGTILANPLPGYSGGSIALSGNNVTVQASTAALPSGFGFDTPVPSGLSNTLTIAAPSLSGQGFQTIGLGCLRFERVRPSVAASTVEYQARRPSCRRRISSWAPRLPLPSTPAPRSLPSPYRATQGKPPSSPLMAH